MSTYCVEHELLMRAAKESERAQAADDHLAADAVLDATAENMAQEPAQL